jgi:hypothetical protein
MADKLLSYFIDLVLDATLKSFWTRRALRQFLRRCHVSEQFLATWSSDETKRDFLYRLFPLLEKADRGESIIRLMATFLSEQETFPDLERWEGRGRKKEGGIARRRGVKGVPEKAAGRSYKFAGAGRGSKEGASHTPGKHQATE